MYYNVHWKLPGRTFDKKGIRGLKLKYIKILNWNEMAIDTHLLSNWQMWYGEKEIYIK